jgi:hypothetical protein
VTQFTFRQLESKSAAIRGELGLGPTTVPPDRTRFTETVHTTTEGDDLGEGALVRYVGFLIEGHFTGKENVNCDLSKQANYDIHLAFSAQRPPASPTVTAAEALECGSITAEIIPRRRPVEWNLLGRMSKPSGQGLKGALAKIIAHDLDRPMRITGQLFFDGSHRVCANGHRVGGQPARASNWEIHPVYAIDVCDFRSLGTCRWDRDDVWTPLHEWLEEE